MELQEFVDKREKEKSPSQLRSEKFKRELQERNTGYKPSKWDSDAKLLRDYLNKRAQKVM